MTLDFLSAFVIGILGSGHCIAMCGGITTMLTSAIDNSSTSTKTVNNKYTADIPTTDISHDASINNSQNKQNKRNQLIITYHIGRIFSYCLIGAIVGFSGSIAAKNIGMPVAGLRLIAAVFLILLGLYIGQWLYWLTKVEALGKGLWTKISPLSRYVIPVDSAKKSLALGALWGWLPCGLVYSTLTWALATGNAFSGAGIMLFFGLGTLPALLTVSFGFVSIKTLLIKPITRKLVAISLIFYGIYSFIVAYQVMI